VAASALPVLPGLSRLLPQAAAADMQTNLSNLVNMRFGMFNHFNMGTFTNEEWATPNLDPKTFAPTGVHCDQWAQYAAQAKMSYGVLTTKHHDGFCLWPTKYNTYNVAYSSYTGGDIVQQYVTAFRNAGLKVGLYFSIWDRTHPVQAYGGHVTDTTQAIQPANIDYVLGQITELLTNYGTIDMFVTDGYAWQMGQQAVPYQRIRELVKSLQPDIVMIDHGALSVPFLGDAIYFEQPLGVTAPQGNTYAALQGTTITPNKWFWNTNTPSTTLMDPSTIVGEIQSLERLWTSFILNCPPNRDGKLDTNITTALQQVGNLWSGPWTGRGALPTQMLRVEHPVTPVAAYATGYHTGEGPFNAIDGYSDLNAETCWSTWSLTLPQSITIDLGGVYSNISCLEYLPKQWKRNNSTDGDITACTISTSTDGTNFTQVATASWAGDQTTKFIEWQAVTAGYVRIQVTAATGGYANIGNLRIGGRTVIPAAQNPPLFPANGTVYRLVNRHSGMVADCYQGATANNTPIIQWPWQNHANQKWTVFPSDDGYYKIRNVNSGTLLEIGGRSRANGGTADIWGDANAPQQQWAITPTGDGYYLLTNRFSGLSLNVDSGSTTQGAAVNQYTYTALPQQQWQIIPS
jgi:alpha-L-fucosidase